MDRLATFLTRFHLNASVFQSGSLCAESHYRQSDGLGYLHVLHKGSLQLETEGKTELSINEPSLVFYMRPTTHRIAPGDNGADVVCGSLDFGIGLENPILNILPEVYVCPLAQLPQLEPSLQVLFAEAFDDHCGRQAIMDRLCEILVILLLRHLMDSQQMQSGLLGGLAHPQLSKAITAFHDRPAESWTLQSLAEQAGMSRARFSMAFRETVGITPGDYVTQWRLGLAKTYMKDGMPLIQVADAVGYASQAAFSRAFSAMFAVSPSVWLKSQ